MPSRAELGEITSREVVNAYLQSGSLAKTRDQSLYATESVVSHVLGREGVITRPRGRRLPLRLREDVWRVYQVIGEGGKRLRQQFREERRPSEKTVFRIISQRKERKSGILGVAAVIENKLGKILICQELQANFRYRKYVGSMTVPMAERGRREESELALQRMVQRELFAHPDSVGRIKDEWEQVFTYPYGRQSLGEFWIGDALVSCFVMRLERRPLDLGGFRSFKVEGHRWEDPQAVINGQLDGFRQGAVEMVKLYSELRADPVNFNWGGEYET